MYVKMDKFISKDAETNLCMEDIHGYIYCSKKTSLGYVDEM